MNHIVSRTCTEIPQSTEDRSREIPSRSLKEFRSTPAYVLLGDPGSGKSTEFESEKQALGEAAVLITARNFLVMDSDSHPEWREKILFIDGLDEVRAGSLNARTPFEEIRRRLDKLGRPHFRISCRDADWLGDNDRKHLEAVSPTSDVKTLRLDPLTDSNARDILTAHPGIDDALGFITDAKRQGLEGLLINPQSLELLVSAVGEDGGWPQGRLETFDRACIQMAAEQNEEHRLAITALPTERILESAGHLCAVQLISGSMGYTLNNDAAGVDYIALDSDSALAPEGSRSALSTKLFKGEGRNRFKPVHRHIAEFLGARYLSALIGRGLPARRVVSLITGNDGVVVSELRGLSAWLAALSTKARSCLINADPVGVALYGDIRRFSTDEKRTLLRSLSREAPRLGYAERSSLAFEPLASLDMEPTLREVFTDKNRDVDHQSTTVFLLHVLQHGKPLPNLSQTLLDIVRDDSWWSWISESALDAFICNSNESFGTTNKLKELLSDVHGGRIPDPDNQLLGTLLTQLYPEEVTPSQVWGYLAAGARTELVGRYVVFWDRIVLDRSSDKDACVLLDGLQEWLPSLRPALEHHHLDLLPSRLLARALRAYGDTIATERLHCWLSAGSFRGLEGFRFHDESIGEVRTWLEERPGIQKSVFLEGLLQCQDKDEFMLCAVRVMHSLYGSVLPPDFGLWSLNRSVALMETAPRVSEFLLQLAVQSLNEQTYGEGLSRSILLERTRGHQRLESRLDVLLNPTVPAKSAELHASIEKYSEEDRRRREEWVDYVRSNTDALRGNQATSRLLFELGKAYYGYYPGRFPNIAPQNSFGDLLGNDNDLIEATLAGLRGTVWREDIPEPDDIIRLKLESRMSYLAFPFLAGMDEVQRVKPEKLNQFNELQIRKALTFHFCTPTGPSSENRAWYAKFVDSCPELVADVLVQYAAPLIRAGHEHISGLYELANMKNHAQVARRGSLRLLRTFPIRCTQKQINALDNLLWAALQHADREALSEVIASKLSRKSMNVAQRVHWLAAGIVISPTKYRHQLEGFVARRDERIRQLAAFLSPKYPLSLLTDECRMETLESLIRLLGTSFGPFTTEDSDWNWVTPEMEVADLIAQLLRRLASVAHRDATYALSVLTTDPALSRWRGQLEQAQSAQRTIHRDAAYRHPSVEQVQSTLSNRSPANAGDLTALLLDLIDEIAIRIRTGNTDDWRQYWNEDSHGRPEMPKHEESCRDALLSDLRERLPDGVDGQPEGQYANDNRADIRVGYEDFNVPIEVKKSTHRDLWSALKGQLIAKYARDPATSGYGIYLVLWFGDGVAPPPHEGGPTTPNELRARLEETLSEEEARRISVFVMDVSASDKPLHSAMPVEVGG